MFKIRKGSSEFVIKSVRMPKQMSEVLEEIAEESEISFNNLVIQCVGYALKDYEGAEIIE